MGPVIRVDGPWLDFALGQGRDVFAREVLPGYLVRQRWFPAKSTSLARVAIDEAIALPLGQAVLFVVSMDTPNGGRNQFAVPLALATGADAQRIVRQTPGRVLAEVVGATRGVLHDEVTEALGAWLSATMAEGQRWRTSQGELVGERTPAFAQLAGNSDARALTARAVSGEQSNTSIVLGDSLIVKLIRRLEPGLNPDYEIGRHLTEVARFPGVPALGGAVLWHAPPREPIVVAIAQAFVPGAVPLREQVVAATAAFMRDQLPVLSAPGSWAPPAGACAASFDEAAALGRKTGDLHMALAGAHGAPAFEPEPTSSDDCRGIADRMHAQVALALDVLAQATDLVGTTRALAAHVLDARASLLRAVDTVAHVPPGVHRIRVHGDYQLDQVLVADGDFVIIDFEGEPLRPLAERRAKSLALKDVAGMARSYSYAAYAALFDVAGDDERVVERLDPVARWWQSSATAAFVRGYRESVGRAAFVPATQADFDTLLTAFLVEKATYELRYEIGHRPRWLRIPLRGMAELMARL